MERNDFIEKIIGGIFAVVAVIAAIAEIFINGISTSTIIAGVKDIFGTLAVIVLFLAVIKDKIPKRKFEDKLTAALETWINDNSNMIIRKPEHDKGEYYSLDMKTDVADFYNNSTHKKTGLFVRIPEIKKENYTGKTILEFHMNKGTFFADIPQEKLNADNYRTLGDRFCSLVKGKHEIVESAITESTNQNSIIIVTLKRGINTKTDIDELVDVLNTMYTAYLVSARIKNNYGETNGT